MNKIRDDITKNKVYCIDASAEYPAIGGSLTILKRTEALRYTDEMQVERQDCNKCKHKFICLIEPDAQRWFESNQ